MTPTEGENVPPINAVSQIQRPTRALIGWMTLDDAKLWLAGRRIDQQPREEHTQRAERARAAVASRPFGLDQSNLIGAAPENLAGHIEALRQHAAGASYFSEGWEVAIADLSRVCAVQPQVYTDQAAQRIAGVTASDVVSLASISLPIPASAALPVQFDQTKQAWVFSSPNPNLRILGQFRGQAQPGVNCFGFVVVVAPSFLQVASYRGRYLLRDGYHRAYGFLSRGITRVPVFVRQFETFDELALPAGLLSQDAFLGDRPPLLVDYFNDEVSADLLMPAIQKVVIIQGLELGTLG
jgi:hypothetical protein